MQPLIEITFRGMSPSPAVDAAVRQSIERLTHVFERIHRCHVWIELPHRHRRRGARFSVRITLDVPGDVLAVSHEPGHHSDHSDLYIALADAFLAMRRKLAGYAGALHDQTKPRAAVAARY